jgi:hypothetical protein
MLDQTPTPSKSEVDTFDYNNLLALSQLDIGSPLSPLPEKTDKIDALLARTKGKKKKKK